MTIRNIFRWAAYLVAFLSLLIILAVLVIRFFVFPNINNYKDDIATYASKTMQRKVTIGDISTGWHHLSPRVTLANIDIYDEQNRPALTLQKVDTQLSWLSIGLLDLRLSELTAYAPTLIIRRSKEGVFYLAGVNLSGRGNPDFANWLLAQSNVGVQNANITYIDELRQAPPLVLKKLNLTLSNSAWKSIFGRHEFKLDTFSSVGTKQPIKLSGYFIGRDMSNIKDWRGNVHLAVQNTDISVWRAWVDYPLEIKSGMGNAEADLHFSALAIDEIEANIRLQHLSVHHAHTDTPLIAPKLQGHLGWKKTKTGETLTAKDVNVAFNTGLKVESANGEWERTTKKNQAWIDAYVSVQALELSKVVETARYFKLSPQWMEWIEGISPSGKLTTIKGALSGHPNQLQNYALSGEFKQLSIQPYGKLPGFNNLTGNIDLNERKGEVQFDTHAAALDLKDILRWPVPIDSLQGAVEWQTNKQGTTLFADQLIVKNPHISGVIKAKFAHQQGKGDFLDLHATFDQGNAKFAPFYYPIILGKETLHWLDTSILAGRANDVNVIIKGRLADFPFVNAKNQPDAKLGQFKVTAQIEEALIEYGTGWPLVRNLNTQMLFEGKRMLLNANKGDILGNKIISSKIEIPQLDADWPMLHIASVVEGPVREGIKFVNESPVKEVAMGFTESLKTAGDGHLDLDLLIPMQDLEAAKYKGAYQIKNGTLFANDEVGLPELSKINGTLNFTENGLNANNISTEVLGGPARITLMTGAEKSLQINASGRINDAGIKKVISHPIVNALQGTTDWKGDILIKKPLADFTFSSNLVGMAVNLPSPMTKATGQIYPLRIDKVQRSADNDEINMQYGDLISAKIARNTVDGKWAIDRGEIGINTPVAIPAGKGLVLKAKLDTFDVDEWLAFFKQNTPSDARGTNALPPWLSQADVYAGTLNVLNRDIHQFKASAKPSASGIKFNIQSQEMTGDVTWQTEGNGKITAKLKNLVIPNVTGKEDASAKKEIKRVTKQYPALDLDVENFEIGDKKLGALTVDAFENGDDWQIQKLSISNTDFTLLADGTWHNWTRSPNTTFKFNLQSDSIGRSLRRFGQPDAVKGGKATLSGQLRWPGSPHEFETSGLNGNLKLEAEKGQIVKVQPGVGRLLGLLSLQSLPRRLSLDFRDLFSDGFAFDKISATATATGGVLRSNDFYMTGPAAEAKIQGETNLKTETQNLKVTVIPHVSDSLSLAALAGGPIVGAAAFVAQKILKDPFNKIASTDYVITGTWDNPQEIESKKDAPQKQDILNTR
ncbi:YhdP family protein [Methylotenera sp. 1P/1]|uniref:YhdP family protein n=1 Tax=Methylotenera sp. 1P/1 TaxID=1131551 RepID=UPI00035C756A|nr:YhdP family protein [Methylotenera sp. 1P/1]